MNHLFYNANLLYSCPTRYYRYITGFEDYFYGNASCAICPDNAVQNSNDDTTCICAPGYILREELRESQGDIAKTNTDCVVGEFKVFYDCNGGSGNPTPSTIDIAYGATFITATNTCEKEGYDFAGWAVDKDTTNIKPENERLEFIWPNNITLQAVWSPIITPVVLDSTMYIGETDFRTADTDAAPDRLWSEYLGGWYTDSNLTPESKIEKLTTLPRVNGYLFRGFSQNKTLNQEDVETMYFASNGSVKNSGAFGTTDEVILHAHYKPCTCTLGEGVESCEVVGTNDNNQCIYEVACAQYYIGDRTVLGQANIPSYTVTCDVAPLYTIKLDSLYYDSATDTEGALVTTNATPNTLYIKQNWGWFIDNSGVVPATDLTNIPVNDHFAFKGFYTGKAGTGIQVVTSDGKLITTPDVLNAFTSDATIYAYYEPQKYSISFDCGISSGTPHDTMLVTYGQFVNIPDDGACGDFICGKFMGWKISDTDLIIPKTDGLKWEYDTDKVLTAIYDTTYNIKYEANNERASGNAPESPVKCTEEAECLVPENTYYVYGNDFIGWSCTGNNECDNGIILQPGYNLNNFGTCYGDVITLIAQWKNSKFNIIYNPNGGSGDNPTLSSCEFGTECLVPENPYTYSGHSFVNWKYETDTNQSGLLEPNNDLGSLFSANPKTVTLTAQWNTISYN
ncbi:MAG: InlB B-repeat-containing protein, partial [Alphaproteobacteria bacterium]|nr:InlB B-repeat-containing protein [Alphaproteobacteria bacterium]